MREGFLPLVTLQEQLAKIAVGLGQDGVELHRLAEVGEGLGLVTQEPQGVAQVVPGHGVARLEPHGRAELRAGGPVVDGPRPCSDRRSFGMIYPPGRETASGNWLNSVT